MPIGEDEGKDNVSCEKAWTRSVIYSLHSFKSDGNSLEKISTSKIEVPRDVRNSKGP